jgi:hypothetical protein
VERTIEGGVPKAAEQAMENLKWYVVFLVPSYHNAHVGGQDPWGRHEEIRRPCEEIVGYTDIRP